MSTTPTSSPLTGERVMSELGEVLIEFLPRVPETDPFYLALDSLALAAGVREELRSARRQGSIELTEAESDAIIWHVDSEIIAIGDEMDHFEREGKGPDDLEECIVRSQLNATLWREAAEGVLTLSAEIQDWLEGMRSSLAGGIRDDRNPGEGEQHLAAVEGLLGRLEG